MPLPECPDPIVVEWLMEAGPVMVGSMGAVPLTYQELESWQRLAALPLQPWEAQLIVRLSREYCTEQALAGDEHRPPPYGDTRPARALRDAVARTVRTSLSAAAHAEPAPAIQRRRRKNP